MSEHLQHLELLGKIKEKLKSDPVMQEAFKKHGISTDEIDHIPVVFADLDVSARTDHGIIYLNRDLLETPERIDHYLAHEFTHYAQQTTGDGPTKGSTDDTYLDNDAEKEGFQTQTEYISETRGDDAAKNYVDKVLEHHDVPEKERKERRDELLQLAQAAGLIKKAAELSGTIDAWHCGKKFGQFSLDFLGHGEGIHYLGPGIYFATSERLARAYARYHNEPWLYHVKIDQSDTFYDPNRGLPLPLREKAMELQNELSKEFSIPVYKIDPTDSFKYGKSFIGFLVEKFGRTEAIHRLSSIGINGIYENLPGDVVEICVFDLSLVKIVDAKRLEKTGKDYVEAVAAPEEEPQQEERKERRGELLELASEDPIFKAQATILRRLWKLDE